MNHHRVQPGTEVEAASDLLSKLQKQLSECDQSNGRFPLTLGIDAPQLSQWHWLHANRGLGRVVWSDRSSLAVTAGVGVAASVQRQENEDISSCILRCRELLGGNSTIRFFGGLSFDGTDGWQSFGAGRFVIPRLILADGKLQLTVMNEADVDVARLELQNICFESATFEASLPTPTQKSYSPTVDGWQSRIDEALSLIRSEVLEKIVLSRKTTFKFENGICPIALSARLKDATHDCFVFCFDFAEGNSFVGATPERLFLREGATFRSEVVAGTRMRGETPNEDEKLAIELITSDKDQREHDIVRKSIRQKLHKFVDHLDVDSQASILRLARKQHLRSDVSGTLKDGVDDGMLLKRLHPTPAVGGYPTENALPEIARIEPFNRGWYAAPVGWIGADSAQFAVGIRSGLVAGKDLSLFSGAGIVRGSDPDQEWMEVENKIQDFIGILGDQ